MTAHVLSWSLCGFTVHHLADFCEYPNILSNITFIIVHEIEIKDVIFLLTSEPHHAIFTSLEEQLIYNERGWDRLRGRGVDFRAVILKER